jgi:hypothetical protein
MLTFILKAAYPRATPRNIRKPCDSLHAEDVCNLHLKCLSL